MEECRLYENRQEGRKSYYHVYSMDCSPEAAKKAFDALGGKPIPKVAQLSQEYAALLAEKQERYAEYKALRQDMIDYRTMKQNVDKILGLVPEEQEQQRPER